MAKRAVGDIIVPTEAYLRKIDLIDFIPESEGKAMLRIFQGRRVIVDDSLPVRAGLTDGQVYTTFLLGRGSFARGVAPLDGAPLLGGFGSEGVELAQVPLDSDTVLLNRRRYILHQLGVKFTSADVAGDSPRNAELEKGANWSRVWESKNVRIVTVRSQPTNGPRHGHALDRLFLSVQRVQKRGRSVPAMAPPKMPRPGPG